jgi:YecR-like lipoprotein
MRSVLVLLVLLAGCAGPEHRIVAGKGGVVAMASDGTIWDPVTPDWRAAQAAAERRCRARGYDGAGSFAGWREACRGYDLSGRCVTARVTRYYPCRDSR